MRSLVFDKGDGGSKYYRIPALSALPCGSLVAVADRRWDSLKDLPGRIDVVARRSDDGGKTWGATITIAAADSVGGYGDPAIGLDPASGDLVCIMTHGQGLWESTPGDHARIAASRSNDGGLTWSRPQPIYISNEEVIDGYIGAFATSGAISSTADGKLMFVLVVRDDIKKWSRLKDYACISSDGGTTWRLSQTPADTDGDEAKIVELSDGSLLMSIRNRRKGERKFSTSTDGGITWSEPWHGTGMIEPGCNGDILRIGDRLLQTVPAHPAERRNVTLFESLDNGRSWQPVELLCPAPSAYSAMALMPDGSLAFLIEEGASDGGYRIWLTRIDKKIIDKKIIDKGAPLDIPTSSARESRGAACFPLTPHKERQRRSVGMSATPSLSAGGTDSMQACERSVRMSGGHTAYVESVPPALGEVSGCLGPALPSLALGCVGLTGDLPLRGNPSHPLSCASTPSCRRFCEPFYTPSSCHLASRGAVSPTSHCEPLYTPSPYALASRGAACFPLTPHKERQRCSVGMSDTPAPSAGGTDSMQACERSVGMSDMMVCSGHTAYVESVPPALYRRSGSCPTLPSLALGCVGLTGDLPLRGNPSHLLSCPSLDTPSSSARESRGAVSPTSHCEPLDTPTSCHLASRGGVSPTSHCEPLATPSSYARASRGAACFPLTPHKERQRRSVGMSATPSLSARGTD